MKLKPILLKPLIFLLVFFIAWGQRVRATTLLSVDFDEDDYLRAAQEYAILMRTSHWEGFLEANYRQEHPPIAKIIFGVALLTVPEKPLIEELPTLAGPNKEVPRLLLTRARRWAASMGALEAGMLALVNPLGGLLLALHAMTSKYTSQVMLESLPALTSLLAVMTYAQFKKSRRGGWWIASAVFLGLTAASKYLYALVGFAILADWLVIFRGRDAGGTQDRAKLSYFANVLAPVFMWGILSLLVFLAADPYLWPDPPGRLQASLSFNVDYSQSAREVKNADFPFWQPFRWLLFSVENWHPGVFYFPFDPLISILASVGWWRLWKREPVYVLWLVIGLAFLLVWPTKWPQYLITLTAPLCLAAAETVKKLLIGLVNFIKKD